MILLKENLLNQFSIFLLFPSYGTSQLIETYRVDIGQPLYPEGIAYDKVNDRVILSSFVSPIIATFDVSNNFTHLTTYNRDDEATFACLGLKMDPIDSDMVWCAGGNPTTFDEGGLAAYKIEMSNSKNDTAFLAIKNNIPCNDSVEAGPKCGFGNDLIWADDHAFMTESIYGRVFGYNFDNGLVGVSDDPLLFSPGFGANGVVYHESKILILANIGRQALVRIDLISNEVVDIELSKELGGGPDGLLLLHDGRLVAITAISAIVLSDSSVEGFWYSAHIDEIVDIDQSAQGELATTASHGSYANEIFVTYVRFGDIFGGTNTTVNADPSLIGRVLLR